VISYRPPSVLLDPDALLVCEGQTLLRPVVGPVCSELEPSDGLAELLLNSISGKIIPI
jgi:hypothetical protein